MIEFHVLMWFPEYERGRELPRDVRTNYFTSAAVFPRNVWNRDRKKVLAAVNTRVTVFENPTTLRYTIYRRLVILWHILFDVPNARTLRDTPFVVPSAWNERRFVARYFRKSSFKTVLAGLSGRRSNATTFIVVYDPEFGTLFSIIFPPRSVDTRKYRRENPRSCCLCRFPRKRNSPTRWRERSRISLSLSVNYVQNIEI